MSNGDKAINLIPVSTETEKRELSLTEKDFVIEITTDLLTKLKNLITIM